MVPKVYALSRSHIDCLGYSILFPYLCLNCAGGGGLKHQICCHRMQTELYQNHLHSTASSMASICGSVSPSSSSRSSSNRSSLNPVSTGALKAAVEKQEYKRLVLASLSFQTSLKKYEMDSIWNEGLGVIYISLDNLLRNQP